MADLPLYEVVDSAYRAVVDVAPFVDETPEASAATLGALGSFLVVKGIQKGSEKLVPGFHEKVLPTLEKIAIGGTALIPLAVGFYAPGEVRDMIVQHPTYTMGMLGAMSGSVAGALHDLYKRKG